MVNIHAAGVVNEDSVHSSVERYDVASDSWAVVSDVAFSTVRIDFGAQVMTLEVGLFDSLKTKARRAREWYLQRTTKESDLARHLLFRAPL
jgi:hypothetical protein